MEKAAKAINEPVVEEEIEAKKSKIDDKFEMLKKAKEDREAKGEEDVKEMSKKELRKAKKEARGTVGGGGSGEFSCNVCKTAFESKSKLFKHIKATGHALAK